MLRKCGIHATLVPKVRHVTIQLIENRFIIPKLELFLIEISILLIAFDSNLDSLNRQILMNRDVTLTSLPKVAVCDCASSLDRTIKLNNIIRN